MKKVLVLGLGLSGRAAIELLLKKGKKIVAYDDNEIARLQIMPNENVAVVSDIRQINFFEVKMAVVSPGVAQTHPVYQKLLSLKKEIISEVELAYKHISNYSIAITGTNGKTTATLFLAHVLNHLGYKAKVLGNVGKSICSYAVNEHDPNDILIVEMSSFQLERLNSLCFDKALILNITPDHLDRYKDFAEYAQTKINIAKNLKEGGVFYIGEEVFHQFGTGVNFGKTLRLVKDDIYEAAYVILKDMGLDEKKVLDAKRGFVLPKHRLEFVKAINDVEYYNDSKATNVFSVLYAVKKMTGPVILIAGGVDKGFSYMLWKNAFHGKVKKILAIGQSAAKIKEELSGFDVEILQSLELAVNRSYSIAEGRDTVLLSPGCSSYDMFKNYEDRGEKFKIFVNNLAKQERVK